MSYSLSLRPRALAEIEKARDAYEQVEHGDTFRAESIHRALLKRYPFAFFFRIRPKTEHVIVLAVLPQRADPARWPQR